MRERIEHVSQSPDRSRSDIVIWLCSVVLLVGVIAVLNLGEVRNLGARVRLLGGAPGAIPAAPTPTAIVAIIVAALIAVGLISARSSITRLPWPWMQTVTTGATFGWTMSLAVVRAFPDTGGTAATYAGQRFIDLLESAEGGSRWLSLAIVAALAAIATGFLNAGMQSLCGSAQARRFSIVIALSPLAAWYAEGSTVLMVVLVSATLGLAAMASERGRGLGWSTSLGVVAGLLLCCATLAQFEGAAAGVGVLCIFFLRRRSLMILVAAIGLAIGLVVAFVAGWSWTRELSDASRLSQRQIGVYAALIVVSAILVFASSGATMVASWRKLRCTPAWPLMLTGLAGLVFTFAARTFTGSVMGAIAPWIALLMVAAVAPRIQGGTPRGPAVGVAAASAVAALAWTAFMSS
ncbi:hypothetical protein CLV47_102438 [Antricoccus suffuscus]|uniref:Uncharacterized protein n=1 Tax=Antricoccus suffuscus TaxID=1629062 RepID=A0A2T1A5I6_9ACTN|nr:hypothetical protein [Antricoccus suffuscus]PRZ43747.1 hypothetical protein CLV47_102438 [Antricoccus suffuscus]